jgi:hypothetical protein
VRAGGLGHEEQWGAWVRLLINHEGHEDARRDPRAESFPVAISTKSLLDRGRTETRPSCDRTYAWLSTLALTAAEARHGA